MNIGDIAHTPRVLALLEQHIPAAEAILWASGNLTDEVVAIEHRRFPQLTMVKGSIRNDGSASNKELAQAIECIDFLLHGSGLSLVAAKDLAAFVKYTGKPLGVYSITHEGFFSNSVTELWFKAEFVFFRDSMSFDHAKQQDVSSPIMEFGQNGAFACDLRNDHAATVFLKTNNLEDRKFCVACHACDSRHAGQSPVTAA